MRKDFLLDKGLALPLGNALRHLAMSKLPSWRPIAFSLNRKFNLIHASSSIVEDTYKIMSNLGKYKYIYLDDPNSAGDFYKDKFTFTGTLVPSKMKSEKFAIEGEEVPLITCLDDQPVEIVVVYRRTNGMKEVLDNSQFLYENGEDPDSYYVMSSRHTDVSKFVFDVKDHSSTKEILTITLESDVTDENFLMSETLNSLYTSSRELVEIYSTLPETSD